MRRWRDYETAAGRRPVKEFIEKLSWEDRAAVVAAMREVKEEGMVAARHLDEGIYEVRTDGNRVTYRVLFAPQGEAQAGPTGTRGLQKEDSEDAAADDGAGEAASARLGSARIAPSEAQPTLS